MKKLLGKYILFLLLASCSMCVSAQRTNWESLLRELNKNSRNSGRELVITLRSPGDLAKKLTPQECETVSYLRVNGPLNNNDLTLLKELAKRKETINREGKKVPARIDLDLQNARIISSNQTFFDNNHKFTTVLGDYFRDCTGLRSIILPDNITEVGNYAFYCCSNLEYVYMPDGVRVIGNSAFASNSRLNQVDIPNGIVRIGNDAFAYCNALKEFHLPLDLETIGDRAFYSSGLRSIEITDRVSSIGQAALASSYLKDIYVCEGSEQFSSIDGVLYDRDGKTLFFCPYGKTGTYAIPEGTTTIQSAAFKNSSLSIISIPASCTKIGSAAFYNSNISQISLPEGVKTIEANTFEECSNLLYVELPSTIEIIEKEAFRGCKKLSGIKIPEGVTSIGEEAFRACFAFTEIIIPANVKIIGEKAFYYCKNAKTIIMQGTVPPVTKKPSNEQKKVKLIVPAGCKDVYAHAAGWSDIKKIEENK